ncbi:MAG: RyR domain-containing protein [Coriobacteriales bacterium]|jgi:hypothetical protein
MTKPKPRPATAADAVREALAREQGKRADGLKPIEIVKVAISAYQSHVGSAADGGGEPASKSDAAAPTVAVESADRIGLRRGKQSTVDALLFNANYWLAAYEDRIIAACPTNDDARACLKAIAVWNNHALKLNTLDADEVVETFERFCPPFAANNRRGSVRGGAGSTPADVPASLAPASGKGPVPDFVRVARAIAERIAPTDPDRADALLAIVDDLEAEARCYEAHGATGPVDALYDILPAWCLQDRIPLVRGSWWDDCDVMAVIVAAMAERFSQLGSGEVACGYFVDSCNEAVDAYQRDISADDERFSNIDIPTLVDLVHEAREANNNSEEDGYGASLPEWLIAKEQLVWNILVCAVYGPQIARPRLGDSFDLLLDGDMFAGPSVITELAQRAYARYLSTRRADGVDPGFGDFAAQPESLRRSGLARMEDLFNGRLGVLGYHLSAIDACYPGQRIEAFTQSEVEVLAILEHRRWLAERTDGGWVHGPVKDVEAKVSPYLVPWEELPDRVREWNRSTARDIPALLASAGFAITR